MIKSTSICRIDFSIKRRTTPIDVFLGRKLYKRRQELHLSQQEVAKAIGVSFQQLQKYEMGRNRISASSLFLIACTLRVPVSYFFKGLDHIFNWKEDIKN